MRKVSFHTFGCKLNLVDSNDIAKGVASNFLLSEGNLDADIHIINTCAVTNTAVLKAKHLINRIVKKNKNAKVFVIGCAVRGGILPYDNSNITIVDNKKVDLAKLLLSLSDGDKTFNNTFKNKDSVFRSRVFVKIQEGCNSFCTYCIVPYLRGREYSRSIEDVTSEVLRLENSGVDEVVLTGTAIGKYQYGIYNLLKSIFLKTKHIRVRLSSLRPSEVDKGLIKLMKNENLCPHLHISFQSGSNRILRLMNRNDYIGQDLISLSALLYKYLDRPFLAADVIVGFPGETDSDFMQTYKILEQANMTYLHVFPYSPRPNTPAANLPQLNKTQVLYRKRVLNNLSDKNYQKALNKMLGTMANLVWETDYARTDNYFRAQLLKPSLSKNRVMFVHSIKDNILQVI